MEKQASTAGEWYDRGDGAITSDALPGANVICSMEPWLPHCQEEQEANARRIVQCVNSHADMLTALKQAEKYLARRVVGTGGEGERVVLPAIRAAINKATSTSGD